MVANLTSRQAWKTSVVFLEHYTELGLRLMQNRTLSDIPNPLFGIAKAVSVKLVVNKRNAKH